MRVERNHLKSQLDRLARLFGYPMSANVTHYTENQHRYTLGRVKQDGRANSIHIRRLNSFLNNSTAIATDLKDQLSRNYRIR